MRAFCILPALLLAACGSSPDPAPAPVEAPRAGPAATDYRLDSGRLVLPAPVRWQTGSDQLDEASVPVLAFVRGYLHSRSDVTLLRIEVHTDSDGDDAANQRLTEQRALAVARWLVAQGIDCRRLLPVGFGESKPVARNDSPENKSRNRRTEFAPAMLRGRAIGGMPVDGGGVTAGDPCK